MSIPSIIQDCHPGRESFVAKIQCDWCGRITPIGGDGTTVTEHRIRKIANTIGWSSQPDELDSRRKPAHIDFCPHCN